MKQFSTLDVKTNGSLRVKRCTLVFTSHLGNFNINKGDGQEEVTSSNHITVQECKDLELERELAEIPEILKDGGQSTVDDLKELDLGTVEKSYPIYVSSFLTPKEEKTYFNLFSEYKDVFTWSYGEMSELDPKVAVHCLSVKKNVPPKKQPQWCFCPELASEIETKVNKLIEAGFIRKVKYPTWIANVVPVRKKNGQLRICMGFRDLNNTYPKDDFPLSITKLIIDSTMGHEALSSMDCAAGYNQIQMALEDQEVAAFRTPKGICCYKVMPFDLKNAGATYQRANYLWQHVA